MKPDEALSLKILQKKEVVGEGALNNAGKGDDMFLFTGIQPDCLKELVDDAENLTAELPDSYWDKWFGDGKPNKLRLTVADLAKGSSSVSLWDTSMAPDSDNFPSELSTAVRKAARETLRVLNSRSVNGREWVATLRLAREQDELPRSRREEKPLRFITGE